MIVQLALFAQLASSCAPSVAIETLAAVAKTESGFDDTTLHDNTANQTYHPKTSSDAIALATELVIIDRHSVDLGLMQVNSGNLPGLGMTISNAFDACHSLTAGARVLVASYTAPAPGADNQPALIQALSRYNTGTPDRGVANGYVQRVQSSAEIVVPALRLRTDAASQAPTVSSVAPVTSQPLPPLPPSWDVYGRVQAGRGQPGAVIFGASLTPATPVVSQPKPAAPVLLPAPPAQGPVQLRAQTQQAANYVR